MNLIVYFHSVIEDYSDEAQRFSSAVLNRRELKYHVDVLSKNYEFTTISEASKWHSKRPQCVLTFDDGYKNNATVVYPFLRRLGIPFTIYISTNFVDSGNVMWHPRLMYWLLNLKPGTPFTVDRRRMVAEGEDISERLLQFTQLTPVVNEYKIVSNQFDELLDLTQIIPEFSFENSPDCLETYGPMSWDDVKTLAKDPAVDIQSHSHHHFQHGRAPREVVAKSVVESIRMLSSKTGHEPQHFCYPGGSFGRTSTEIVRGMGFSSATTCIPFHWHRFNDMMLLPRLSGHLKDPEAIRAYMRFKVSGLAKGLLKTGRQYWMMKR